MAKYLVTGAAGFIGSSIVRGLIERGENVRGLDNFATGKRENIEDLKGKLDFREASILDEAALADACKGVDYIFHEAALPSVPKSVAEPKLTNATNVDGTLNVLLAARDLRGVFFCLWQQRSVAQAGRDDRQTHFALCGTEAHR